MGHPHGQKRQDDHGDYRPSTHTQCPRACTSLHCVSSTSYIRLLSATNQISGTQKHQIKTFNLNDGHLVSTVEPYSGFLRDRSAPIAATAFHPHRLMIAAAALHDNHVNLYACHEPKHAAPALKTVKLWDGGVTTPKRVSTFN